MAIICIMSMIRDISADNENTKRKLPASRLQEVLNGDNVPYTSSLEFFENLFDALIRLKYQHMRFF